MVQTRTKRAPGSLAFLSVIWNNPSVLARHRSLFSRTMSFQIAPNQMPLCNCQRASYEFVIVQLEGGPHHICRHFLSPALSCCQLMDFNQVIRRHFVIQANVNQRVWEGRVKMHLANWAVTSRRRMGGFGDWLPAGRPRCQWDVCTGQWAWICATEKPEWAEWGGGAFRDHGQNWSCGCPAERRVISVQSKSSPGAGRRKHLDTDAQG